MRNADLYDIVTALRGPDIDVKCSMKYLFTARLRYILRGGGMALYGIRMEPKVMLTALATAVTMPPEYTEPLVHYLHHVVGAFTSLAQLTLGENKEIMDLRMLAEAMLNLYNSAKEYENKTISEDEYVAAVDVAMRVISKWCEEYCMEDVEEWWDG